MEEFKAASNDCGDDDYNAVDALLDRGEMMRKLRQLEREDEAQRQEEPEQVEEHLLLSEFDDHDTLCYPRYLANQRGIYDDYKHVNYSKVDFGLVGGSPLILHQDRHVGKGGIIWDAGYILADSIIRNYIDWSLLGDRPQRVVELGAGTGVTGLLIARAFPMAQVHLTDLPQLQPLLELNIKSCEKNATFGVLEWGKPVQETYDVILGADVVAGIYDAQGLVRTLSDLSHEQTHIFITFKERLSGIMDAFIDEMKELFDVVEKGLPESENRNPNVYLLRISAKRRFQ